MENRANLAGYTYSPSFITLSSVLEGVGTSAYLGAAPLITSKQCLTVAGAILVAEALHTSYQRAATAVVPFANPYGTVRLIFFPQNTSPVLTDNPFSPSSPWQSSP